MRFKFLSIFIFFALYAFSQVSSNTTSDNYFQKKKQNVDELKILSWNIFMLPGNTFKFSSAIKRSKIIVEELLNKDYDIICLQELFHKKSKKIITEGLKEKYPYQIGCSDNTGFIHTNSGLWIFSKNPLIKIDEITFNDCLGSDCIAKKGALIVEFNFLGKNIQLVNTHLQSGKKGDRDNIRLLQAKQIYSDFILSSNNLLQILCGDFNTSSHLQKLEMLSIFQAIDGKLYGDKKYSWPSLDYYKGYTTLLDYVFLRNSQDIQIERKIIEISCDWKKWGKKRTSLSDHLSVEAIIKF